MVRTGRRLILLGVMIGLPGLSLAARPFATQDAGTTGGGTELEAVLDVAGAQLCSGLGFTQGLGPRLDLALGVCFTHAPAGERSFDGTVLGAKFALLPGLLSLAGGGEAGRAARNLELACTRELAGLTLDLSAGAAWELSREPEPVWGLALCRPGRALDLGLELGGDLKRTQNWLVGLRRSIGTASLDAGLGGAFGDGSSLAVTAGLTLGLAAH
ncbi:MAG: hypothetical protein WC326_08745 [Candidatus Delongbacteria bacterium]